MDRPSRPAPSRGFFVALAVLAVVAVVVAVLSLGSGPVQPASPAPTATAGGSSATASGPSSTAPSPTTSATPLPTDTPVGVARWAAVTSTAPGPAPRSGHSWTVDPSSAVAYLFGGRGPTGPLADVWAYDLTADRWSQLRPDGEGPTARFEHGAAWVDGLGVVVFGGRTEAGVLDDFWAFDPGANAWRTLDVAGPQPSARAAACVALRTDGRMWLYGGAGASGAAPGELWTYGPGPSSWSQHEVDGGPGGRAGSACWWSADDRLVVHGGLVPDATSSPLGDLWAFDPDAGADGAWQSVDRADLAPRARAAVTMTSHGGLVVGGVGEGDALLADAVVFDATSLEPNVLRSPADGPAARSGAALADDPEGERTLLYGGLSASGPLGDLWGLDLP
ncbi:MAG TPA: kelch repeat-containing protein [Candidatus Limnocylindrales bacterium]|nr:kelch repeat-containing protein [Candidatus Limnocylindrales bacterium]